MKWGYQSKACSDVYERYEVNTGEAEEKEDENRRLEMFIGGQYTQIIARQLGCRLAC